MARSNRKQYLLVAAYLSRGVGIKQACEEAGFSTVPDGIQEHPEVVAEMERLVDEALLAARVSVNTIVVEVMDVAKKAKEKGKYGDAVAALRTIAEMKRLIGPNSPKGPLEVMGFQGARPPQDTAIERTKEDDDAYETVLVK